MARTKVAFILLVALRVGFVNARTKRVGSGIEGRHAISLTSTPGQFSEPSIAENVANSQQLFNHSGRVD
jgi:hypothetical protein